MIRAVLFDAAGTLIHPDPPVDEAYHTIGRKVGSSLSVPEVAARFKQAWARRTEAESRFARRPTDHSTESRNWRRIVSEVFFDVPDAGGSLFTALWDHFSDSQNWAVYEDVAPTWQWLAERDYVVGIASNFDDRLPALCAELCPLDDCQHLFWSARIGHPKPSPKFFLAIQRRLDLAPQEIFLVGDDLENDVHGARAAGWKAVHLNRQAGRQGELAEGSLNNLRDLAALLASAHE